MLTTRSNGLVSSLPRSVISARNKPFTTNHNFSTQTILRYQGIVIDYNKLHPSRSGHRFRPFLQGENKFGGRDTYREFEYSDLIRRVDSVEDDWPETCSERYRVTGLPVVENRSNGPRTEDGTILINDQSGAFLTIMWFRAACRMAFRDKIPVRWEVAARRLCAETKNITYPTIYHSLTPQADMLYVLGRLDLERDPIWRGFAAYMLSIAVGLGHLDSALLLHQLGKAHTRYSLKTESIQVIRQAVKERCDWRALVAYSEYLMWNSKGRSGRGTITEATAMECMALLSEAIDMTNPQKTNQVKREHPPKEYIDAETLEAFDPPHKLLLEIASKEILAGQTSTEMIALFEKAARVGAYDYGDVDAAWHFVQRRSAFNLTPDAEWAELAEFVARSGNANACIQLAKYHLVRDGWYPTLADKLDKELEIADMEARSKSKSLEEARLRSMIPLGEEENEIIRRRDTRLLEKSTGIMWIKTAAQLQNQNAQFIAERYCMLAGLYRQNGFREEGAAILEEGREALNVCVDTQRNLTKCLEVISEYLDGAESRPLDELPRINQLDRWLDKYHSMGNIYLT